MGQGLLIIEALQSHTDTTHSVGLLWTSDRPIVETSTLKQKHSQETEIDVSGGIRTGNPSKRAATDLRLRPRGHWDQR